MIKGVLRCRDAMHRVFATVRVKTANTYTTAVRVKTADRAGNAVRTFGLASMR
jgi:hypothetical protein